MEKVSEEIIRESKETVTVRWPKDDVQLVREYSPQIDGKTFVFTGKLESMTRAEAYNEITSSGGRINGSISLSTNYLVCCGDGNTKKASDAVEKGVCIISENQWLDMLNNNNRE